VANAIGAVVGQVRVSAEAGISQPVEGVFRVSAAGEVRDFPDEEAAIAHAEASVRRHALAKATEAGAVTPGIEVRRDIKASTVDSRRMFVEAQGVAGASGRPRIAD